MIQYYSDKFLFEKLNPFLSDYEEIQKRRRLLPVELFVTSDDLCLALLLLIFSLLLFQVGWNVSVSSRGGQARPAAETAGPSITGGLHVGRQQVPTPGRPTSGRESLMQVVLKIKQCCESMTCWCGSGSMPLIRILLFSSLTFKMPAKTNFFSAYYFLKVHLHHFSKIKSQKEVTKH